MYSIALHGLEVLLRTLGDATHVMSILVLLVKMQRTKSCSGISLKSQILYMAVFLLRYSDLIFLLISPGKALSSLRLVYNSIMKVVFLCTQYYIVDSIANKYRYSYDSDFDDTPLWIIAVPAVIGGTLLTSPPVGKVSGLLYCIKLLINWMWTTSVVLESISIVPQLVLLHKAGEGETLTVHYVVFLGAYRLLYLLGWLLKWANGVGVTPILVWGSVMQVLLYSDMFVSYFRSFLLKRKKITFSPLSFLKEAFYESKA